jgi:hypothetical protein
MTPTVPPPMAPMPPARPSHNGRNLAAGAILLVGGILALVSIFVSWWYLSESGGTVNFLPGTSASGTFGGTTSTLTYSTLGIGWVGGLYIAILALAIVVGVLALVAGILGVIGGAGALPARHSGLVRGLAVAVVVIAIAAIAVAPGLQPWAFHQTPNSGACTNFNSGGSPCSSFWGSGNGDSWGAGVGWYLMIGALVLGLVGLILWRVSRPMTSPTPWTPGAAPPTA